MTDSIRFYDRALQKLTRRELLNIAWKIGLAAVAQPIWSTRVFAQPLFRTYPFPLGVASGEPLPDGVVLWTRLAPEPLAGGGMPMANVEVAWEVAKDRAFASIATKGTAVARPELGHSVRVEAGGLEPGREYFYRFRVGREVSQTGRTKTAPPAGAAVDRLRFAVCGCSHYETGYFTAYRRLAAEQFDFVFHTGDYIYEGREDGGKTPAVVRQHHGDEIYTLVDYRNRYAQYKMDPDLRAAHASAPFVVTWDDHEVDNDYAGDRDENDTPPEVFLLRRAAAYQAYFETMPLRAATHAERSEHAAVSPDAVRQPCIDLERARHASVPLEAGVRRDDARPVARPRSIPSRTILGSAQEQWLFEQLGAVKATWTVLGQQVPTFARDNLRAAPNERYSMDKWDGYVASRQRLYARLKETKAPNPIVLSGDVHLHYGADLKMDFANPKSETVGVEFTNTSVTSGGDGADVERNLGTHPRRQPAHQVSQRAPRLHRLHGDAGDDARRLQDPRPRDRA